MRTLRDRLRALAPAEAAPAAPAPGRLPDESIPSLKQRLEALVAAAVRTRGPLREVRERTGPPIEILFPNGRVVENDRGTFFLLEQDQHLDTWHGNVCLSRFLGVDPAAVPVLSGDPAHAGFDLHRAVFLDTETTGISGGAGTAAFLVGVGFVRDDRFVVRQYVMRDYEEEAALLGALAEDLRGFRHLVTYNGRTFDLPLLETRYRLCRTRYPLARAVHLDLLAPARRLWKQRLVSCRLQSLERSLLSLERHEDVPGEEIPRIYFDYVRRRDGRALARVLEHNRLDVVSLAAVAVLASEWVHEDRAEDPRDVFSLGRVYEGALLYERSEALYQRVVDQHAGPMRVASLVRLAVRSRRRGDHDTALRLWREAAAAGSARAWRELAVHHEHRGRDLPAALDAADRGLGAVDSRVGGARRLTVDLQRRRTRLLRRLQAAAGQASSACR
ncbi:MAG: ribonuclease H-like domain-containing protein [Vicinamibacteria bacterium]